MVSTFINPVVNPEAKLGTNAFTETGPVMLNAGASTAEVEIVIRAAYKQVLGNGVCRVFLHSPVIKLNVVGVRIENGVAVVGAAHGPIWVDHAAANFGRAVPVLVWQHEFRVDEDVVGQLVINRAAHCIHGIVDGRYCGRRFIVVFQGKRCSRFRGRWSCRRGSMAFGDKLVEDVALTLDSVRAFFDVGEWLD